MPPPLRALAPEAALLGALLTALLTDTPALGAWQPGGVPLCGDCPSYMYFRDPSLAPDGAGGVFASWFDGHRQLKVQHLNSAGDHVPGWPLNGIAPTTFTYHQNYRARLAADGAGGVYVVWLATFCSSSCSFSWGQVYVQRLTATGQVAPGWPAAGVPVTSEYSLEAPLVSPDGAGGVLIAWKPFLYPMRNLVHVQRVDAAGNRLWLGTPEGAPVAPGSSGSQTAPAIAPDGAGGVFVAWEERSSNPFILNPISYIRLQHFNASGAVFSSSGIGLGTVNLSQHSPRLAGDGAGGVFVAWEDSTESTGFEIHAQRVNALMQRMWSGGVAVTDFVEGDQTDVALLADGANGAFISWSDARDGERRIFAVHLDGSGQVVAPWPEGGLATNTGPGSQRAPCMVQDATGGFFLSWNAGPTHATHLTGTGAPAPGWTSRGVALCSGLCGDIYTGTYLTADGLGGAIAVWDEIRLYPPNGPEQSFAARLVTDGPVAALASLISADAGVDGVRIVWQLSEPARFETQRSEDRAGGGWSRLGSATTDGSGRAVIEDRDVRGGTRYGYRLIQAEIGRPVVLAQEWILVPTAGELRIAEVRPNPATGAVSLALWLGDSSPATIVMLDVAGRRVMMRRLEGLAAGSHTVRIEESAALSPGIYTIRLSQSGRTVRSHVSLTR